MATTTWKTGWDAQNPVHINFRCTPTTEGRWEDGPRVPFVSRDLGLAESTNGKMTARHLRKGSGVPLEGDWQYHDVDFQWLFVARGSFLIESEAGERTKLAAGDSAYLPPYWRHRESDVTADFEAYEVAGPADFTSVLGRSSEMSDPAQEFSHLAPVFNFDRPEAYVQGDGPRSYFEYRDLGLREPTDQRIHLHIVRAATEEPMEGGTGDHHHTMSQWFMPIAGWADIEVEGEESRRMYPGDFMCINAGRSHNVPSYSADYATLEMCVPAEYDTVSD